MSRHRLGQAGQRLGLEFIYKATEINQMRSSNYGPVLIMVHNVYRRELHFDHGDHYECGGKRKTFNFEFVTRGHVSKSSLLSLVSLRISSFFLPSIH